MNPESIELHLMGQAERKFSDSGGGRGVGMEPNQMTARKPGLLFSILHSLNEPVLTCQASTHEMAQNAANADASHVVDACHNNRRQLGPETKTRM
jgi:hypothetical protein